MKVIVDKAVTGYVGAGGVMIVCLCTGVTCREIHQHRADGASTLREVGRRCGAGGQCGSCAPTLRALLKAGEVGRAAPPAVAWQVAAK